VYQHVDLEDGRDSGATVRFSDIDSLAGRVGARFGRTWTWAGDDGARRRVTAWLRPNVWHEFLGNPKTSFSSALGFIPFRADLGGTWMELNAGVTGKIGAATSLFASAAYQTRFDSSYAWNAKIGLRMSW
jgi:outer membrane autotransporter protein